MDYEWDEAKNQWNRQQRGLDFADARWVWEGPCLTKRDERYDYGEERWVTLGLLKGRHVVVVHTEREGRRSIISFRKAKLKEARIYDQYLWL